MDMTLEVVVLPVSDIDRSIAFYRDQVGFHLDHDTKNEHMHVVQLAPPGPGCSIAISRVHEIKVRAQNPLIPREHRGLGEWAGR